MVIEDLKRYLQNPKDKNNQILNELENRPKKKDSWYAGGQLEALKHYLSSKVKILADASEGDYQGTYYAVLFVDGKYFLWRDSFGSCSGCDAIEGLDEEKGYDYIVNTMTSVKEFDTLEEIWKYLKSPNDYLYSDIDLVKELKESYEENKSNGNL